jgi:hypothetical protein
MGRIKIAAAVLILALGVFAQSAPEPTQVNFIKLLYSCESYHSASPLCAAGENPPKAQTITVNDKVDPNAIPGPKASSIRVQYADGTNVNYTRAR